MMHGRKRNKEDLPGLRLHRDEDKNYPTQDNADRHVTDQQLRALGFSILRREAGKEPVWMRQGKEYTQSECEREITPTKH